MRPAGLGHRAVSVLYLATQPMATLPALTAPAFPLARVPKRELQMLWQKLPQEEGAYFPLRDPVP